MKLLYFWIESFRTISNQEVVLDDEYLITIHNKDNHDIKYFSNDGVEIFYGKNTKPTSPKTYVRSISISKNQNYSPVNKDTSISSITTLVGENGSGKTTILDVLCSRTDSCKSQNKENIYYLLVFADNNGVITIKSRGIMVNGNNISTIKNSNNNGFYEYYYATENNIKAAYDNCKTAILNISTITKGEGDSYLNMGIPTFPINLNDSKIQNTFANCFEFTCDFLNVENFIISENDNLSIWLKTETDRFEENYFAKSRFDNHQYKIFFILKFSKIVFSNLRKLVFHSSPLRVSAAGTVIKNHNHDILSQRDRECAEILSFANTFYPNDAGTDTISVAHDYEKCVKDIEMAISFFKEQKSLLPVANNAYFTYIESLEKVFQFLHRTDENAFSALYKLEIPFDKTYLELVYSFQSLYCTHFKGLTDGVNIKFEWLSDGALRLINIFSPIYSMVNRHPDPLKHLILSIDEPEIHMHPQISREFINYLEKAIKILIEARYIGSCQIILATHSIFILQDIMNFAGKKHISILNSIDNKISIQNINNLKVRYYKANEASFNLLLYKFFDMPTNDLHNELYGLLNDKCRIELKTNPDERISENKMEEYFRKNKLNTNAKPYKECGRKDRKLSLHTYIRNIIHHPENERNPRFTNKELRDSIDQMLNLVSLF